jgi:large subunit ribosomal protein L12
MEYVYAALLLHKLNKEVSEENLKKVLEAAGVKPDETRTKALVAALGEVDIDEALKSAVVTAAPAPVATGETPKVEAKEEEKKEEEKKEEEALAGLSSLFG